MTLPPRKVQPKLLMRGTKIDRFSLGDFLLPDWMVTFSASWDGGILDSLFSARLCKFAALSRGAQFLSNWGATFADWSRGFRSQRSVSMMALLYPVQAMESNQEKVIIDGKLEFVSGFGWDDSLLSTIITQLKYNQLMVSRRQKLWTTWSIFKNDFCVLLWFNETI